MLVNFKDLTGFLRPDGAVRYPWGLKGGHGTVAGWLSFPSIFTVFKKKKKKKRGGYPTWTFNLFSVLLEWTKI